MNRRFVDLSIYLENDVITNPPFMRPNIDYVTHHQTMPETGHFFPGVAAEQVAGGEGFAAAENINLSTHNGTHMDAPWHFHPTQDALGDGADQHRRRHGGGQSQLCQYRLRHGLRGDDVSDLSRGPGDRTDAWSWDAPFSYTAQKVFETGDTSLIWEGDKAGRDIGYCHLEKLHNLEALPAHGFIVCCFPRKVRGALAGWTRAVAIFEG